VTAKVTNKLSARKQAAQKNDVERFNLKNLSEMQVRKQYETEISKRLAAWENIKENIKILAKKTLGLYERKQHKLWFDEKCSQLLGQRKQAKMH
jgi:hypothetical protein